VRRWYSTSGETSFERDKQRNKQTNKQTSKQTKQNKAKRNKQTKFNGQTGPTFGGTPSADGWQGLKIHYTTGATCFQRGLPYF